MGVTEHELIAQTVTNIGNVKLLLFAANLCIEEHVQENIA